MKKTAILLMVITIFSKVFGFLREITLSYYYGTSSISDAYIISLLIPSVIFSFIGTGIVTGYIPMYSNIAKNCDEIQAKEYTSNLINALFLISSLIVIVVLLFTNVIINIFASGFQGEAFELAVMFTRISILAVYFTGLVYILSGFLQLNGNYVIPALIGFPMNLIIMVSIYLSAESNLLILSIGSVIAIFSQVVLLVPFVYKNGYKHRFKIDLNSEHLIKMVQIVLPVILGVSIYQINVLVDKTMASRIAIGGISALNYSNRINGFVQGIFVLSISTVMYPLISKMASENNIAGLKKTVSEAIITVGLLVIPATIGSMIFARPIVTMLFGRGAFDEIAISMTSHTLFFYSIGMIGFGLKEVLAKTFYSLQNTKTPMLIAAISLILNIAFNIILSQIIGLGGLALATSISMLFGTTILLISLRRQLGPFGIKKIATSLIKILLSSLLMGILAKLTFNYSLLALSQNISLLLSIIMGIISYFFIIYFMKIDDVNLIYNGIKKKLKSTL